MHALVLKNVSKSFGGIDAVSRVDLTVTKGESRALIGPNGAGKSTLFNLVTGEIPLDRGRITLFGKDMTRETVQKRIASQLGRTYQISNLFVQLTVEENILLPAWVNDALDRDGGLKFIYDLMPEAWCLIPGN